MKKISLFERLSQAISENKSFVLNDQGKALLQTYYKIFADIESNIIPIIKPFVNDVERIKKELAVQIVSTISSRKLGTTEFEIANRLDIMTSGGKTAIDANKFVFNSDDPIFKYIENINEPA